jgi:predicted nucleic acid-binding protein
MVFDAFPLIGHLLGQSDESTELLGSDAPRRALSVNVAEAFDVLLRLNALVYGDIAAAFDLLEMGGLDVLTADGDLARRAGRLRFVHYSKGTSELSLADCFALAAAAEVGEELVTCDPPLAAAARAEKVKVLAVPDSQGRTP